MRAGEHPEELIDRARRGALDAEEQAALERHLAACAVCAAELSVAPRFERELAPQPRDELLYQRAVEGALQRMQGAPRRGRPRRGWARWAAAALLVFGVSAAAAVIRLRAPARPATPAPAPAAETPKARAPIRAVEPLPAEAPAPPEEPPAAKVAPPARAAAHPTVTAEALFEEGERLRRQGRVGAAIATYRRLQAKFPATSEARLSFALAGQLLLEQGRPSDALAQFDRHLSSDGHEEGGQVGEEALAGRATALEQLHRTSEAVAAWKSLLARYPRSVYAERARARLGELAKQQ